MSARKASSKPKSPPSSAQPNHGAAAPSFAFDPLRLEQAQKDYQARFTELMQQMGSGQAPELTDKRFTDPAWREEQGGAFAWTAAFYLLQSQMMKDMLGAVKTDPKAQQKLNFATQQWLDAIAPSNFYFTNPEAQRLSTQTQGESMRKGLGLLNDDIARGRMSQTDETQFEVGRNMATSPGAVVFENRLIQLIQYTPTTKSVAKRPLLIVPPCINKFYILDLQPENSLVAYAVSQGHTVFVVSWCNPSEELGHLTWDDYVQDGAIAAMDATLAITKSKDLNALGFCVGGTIVSTALAVLAARKKHPAASLTLLTTLLDFSETGQLGMFVDEQHLAMREQTIGESGLMQGKELATTFSFLRPNDLVWNYVVNKYLKGQPPPAFDLLYWNSDSTSLPGPMFCWYLRNTYLTNDIATPGKVSTLGTPVDFGQLKMPSFVFAAKEDHIVPWPAALRSAQLLSGPTQFVLGASGHIAGVVNPASKNKRSYWTNSRLNGQTDTQWFEQAKEAPGSWWNAWSQFLSKHKNGEKPAPKALGAPGFAPIEPAPGRYVKVRAV
jgi:polyhydroxyalkanoate synthase subunit PhaC